MVKSMFAGVAGLRAHQSKMDIIGNNIANVNTWGYKAGSMSFKDAMYQSTSSGTGGNTAAGGFGGSNANQIGLGVNTGSITYDFSMGGMSPSSRALDCMIDGDGFFIVGPMVSGGSVTLDSDDAIEKSGLFLSRVGIFQVDNNGYLTDDAGNYVYGFANSSSDLTDSTSFDTSSLQPLKIPTSGDMASVSNDNAKDKVAAAKKKYEEAMDILNIMNNSYAVAQQGYASAKGYYTTEAGKINGTGVTPIGGNDTITYTDLSDLSKRVSDAKSAMDLAYAAWTDSAEDPSGTVHPKFDDYLKAKEQYDAVNNYYIIQQATLRAPKALADMSTAGTADGRDVNDKLTNFITKQKTFLTTSPTDPDYDTRKKEMDTAKAELEELQAKLLKVEDDSVEGKLITAEQAMQAAKAKVATAEKDVKDAKKAWETAQDSETTVQVDNAGADDTLAQLTNYKILEDGTLVGTAKNGGATVAIGKVALAAVQNSSGLVKNSGYYYSPSANSGRVSTFEPGGSAGRILGNYREMSKVDLATELTEMITTQRGFQANSKIITVTDSMLEELVNMKR